MRVTRVELKVPESGEERVLAYATVIFDDDLAVHEVRLVRGSYGPFVAMPDKEIWSRCQSCNRKRPNRSIFCMHCGERVVPDRASKRFVDVVHPLTKNLRAEIEEAVLRAYES